MYFNYMSSLEMVLGPASLPDHPARVGPSQLEHPTHWMYVSTPLTAFKTWDKVSCMWFKVPRSQLWIDMFNCLVWVSKLSLVTAGFACAPVTELDFPSKHTHCIYAWDHLVSHNYTRHHAEFYLPPWTGRQPVFGVLSYLSVVSQPYPLLYLSQSPGNIYLCHYWNTLWILH